VARHDGPGVSLGVRLALLIIALFAEKSALNTAVDFRLADAAHGLPTVLRSAQHFGLRFAVSLAVALAFFICVRHDDVLHRIADDARNAPLRPGWLALHLALLIPVTVCLYSLYGNRGIHLPFAVLGCTAVLLMSAAALALCAALAPWHIWRRAASGVGIRWGYAVFAAAVGTAAILWSQKLWAPTAQLTFTLVRDLLLPVLPTLKANAATRVLSTPDFAIEVSSICSGLEGVGLMLAFCSAWLLYFRAEYRFPRALLIIPAGVLLVFALNVVRIAALVLIGNAGYPAIAIYGFHSQAGWIGFNCVACGVAFASRRSHWLHRAAAHEAHAATSNPTVAYLLPLVALLGAGMVSRAASSGFETWYALRFVAGIALLCCWRPLARLDWRFSWRGIAVGAAVCVLWLAAARFILTAHGTPLPLAAMSAPARDLWIASRVFSGIVLVPLVEELAYRGYLLRRLVAEDFESVPFGTVGWIPLLATAIAFGLLHGPLWLPGVVAGLAYGLLLMRTGRMGEAVAAHATSNFLIAAAVLVAAQWQLW
jgi:exosortase E/protease (VPEID-CTERM system)